MATGTLVCPKCSHEQEKTLPPNVCVPSYKCDSCGVENFGKDKCCIFCDFSKTPCPEHKKE